MGKLVLKICDNSWETASRDRRELSVCQELGARVLVMAKGEPRDRGRSDKLAGFDILYYGTRPLGERVPKTLNRVVTLFQWARYARKLNPDVISGHNLPGLAIGWISNWFVPKRKRALLVYDAHEFEVGRLNERGGALRIIIPWMEKFLMKRCVFSIMINDGIAEEVQRIYKRKTPIVVVRSTPEYWELDDEASRATHRGYCAELGIPENSFVVSYHGNIQKFRGLEEILTALEIDKSLYAVWIGNAQTEETQRYEDSLLQRARETGVDDRLLRYPAQPHGELWRYISASDCDIAMMNSDNPNYKYALPNKFFESIQSLTPVICSDTVEMARIVREYDIGLLVPSGDGEKLAEAIAEMRDNADMYARFKKNLIAAKNDLCWEKEKAVLTEAYGRVL